MSQCIVPNWNLRHQRQEQVEAEDGNRSSHVNNNTIPLQHQHNTSHHLFPMSNYEIAELTWQNGQLAMHGVGGPLPTTPTKPTWGRSGDTLESIVHQATCHKENLTLLPPDHKTQVKMNSTVASSDGKWSDSSGKVAVVPSGLLKKRSRADYDRCGRNLSGSMQEDQRVDRSAGASASATFCKDNDATMLTWASYESPRSLKAKTTDEDSASHGGSENQDEDHENKTETGRSRSSRRSRAAAIHNQSERRRRDRINQKMKALQRLVPNASKTDKASMLDEVIDYLKQLQAQVQMMSNLRNNMPQMMMPLGMQQHIQMSLLGRMAAGMGAVGMGMGMGTMLDLNSMARGGGAPQPLPPLIHHPSPVSTATPGPFVPSPFMMPSMIAACLPGQSNSEPGDSNASVPLPDPYCALLAQSMNMDFYNKMATLFRRQGNIQPSQATSCPSQQSNPAQGN